MKGKKGVSAVVVSILILLIGIIAVGVLWMALKPTIEQGVEQAESGAACISLSLEITSVSYDSGEDELMVKVKRNPGEADLSKMKIIVDGTAYEEINVPEILETEAYNLTNIAEKPSKVEIAGVLTGDKICNVADSADVE